MKTRTHNVLAIAAVAVFAAVPPAAPMSDPRRRMNRPAAEQQAGPAKHRKRLDTWLLRKNLDRP